MLVRRVVQAMRHRVVLVNSSSTLARSRPPHLCLIMGMPAGLCPRWCSSPPSLAPACSCPGCGLQPHLLELSGSMHDPILPQWVSRLVMRTCRPAMTHLDHDQDLAPAEKMLKLAQLHGCSLLSGFQHPCMHVRMQQLLNEQHYSWAQAEKMQYPHLASLHRFRCMDAACWHAVSIYASAAAALSAAAIALSV